MKLITARSQILKSAIDFEIAMKNENWACAIWTMEQKQEILRKLKAIDLTTATVEEVNFITEIPYVKQCHCNECGEPSWEVIQLGEEPDYESNTASICHSCIKKALKHFQE